MPSASNIDMIKRELDTVAWEFLRSEFSGPNYANWPIDRRVEAYLLHSGLMAVANDGAIVNTLLQRVMANVGRALRSGALAQAAV